MLSVLSVVSRIQIFTTEGTESTGDLNQVSLLFFIALFVSEKAPNRAAATPAILSKFPTPSLL